MRITRSQALATGVAESFISSGSTGVDSKVWESLTHFYDVQAWLPRNVVFVNKDAWSALDDATRKAIADCGDKAAAEGTTKSKELTGQHLKTLADNGMKVSDPSDQLKSELNAFGETMTQEWLDSAGEDGKSIIDAYKAM
jgi:TRAP-type C4-dicarboxylate transport system substrate-binding protein